MTETAETETFPVEKTEAEWRAALSPEAFRVLRQHGTERPGASPLNGEKRAGTYHCAGCGAPLFDSVTKFESGTGWPSFFRPVEGAVATTTDRATASGWMRPAPTPMAPSRILARKKNAQPASTAAKTNSDKPVQTVIGGNQRYTRITSR